MSTLQTAATSPPARTARVHRVEVRPRTPAGGDSVEPSSDPRGHAALRDALSLELPTPPTHIACTSVYLIEGDLNDSELNRIATELLADPVTETAAIGAKPAGADALIEVHPLPGVMDPDAQPIELAIHAMLGRDVRVQTGRRYDLTGADAATAQIIAQRVLANPVIHAIHTTPFHPDEFPRGHEHAMEVRSVPLCDLDDAALERLSREAHLFLSLEEMKAIQQEYRSLGREPREIELETLAQTWSEHCVHKTLKARIRYQESGRAGVSPAEDVRGTFPISFTNRPGHTINDDGSVTIDNLLKSTVAAATHELIADGIDWCLSVFHDNSGVIAFDNDTAVCFKVETHNHPSAIEPYGGAATGIGGCIRDIIGTGLAAKPIAASDVFCVAHPDIDSVPSGCLHPRRILKQVVAGVRDYGNRMGIPTLNGTVWFDDNYVGNPLVYCGCIGVMPRDRVEGEAQPGDHIIALGGRTGRDGIHGATFSSAELTDTHVDEFSHAVQIGNPVTEKKVLDAILAARDHNSACLYSGITDCGAGGFSSAVGEMGEKIGATVHLERAPLKYAGLTPTEIWISEAQERMVMSVPEQNLAALRAICDLHDVEMCDLGTFGTPDRDLILLHDGTEYGRLPMEFLHEGIPGSTREAEWTGTGHRGIEASRQPRADLRETLLQLLAHPNIASKHWIIRQYDHEVQGSTVLKPLVGERGDGPGDAAVIQPVETSTRGLAIGNGLATGLQDDPYLMALAAIDECVRNIVCVGGDPSRIAILDNFCWPSCADPANLGSLVRAAEGCYDGAKAYRTPFISGKDSLNNQFRTDDGRTIAIPPTLLISGFGIVPDVRTCVTMDAKRAGNLLVIVGETTGAIGGSHFEMIHGGHGELPVTDLRSGPQHAAAIHRLVTQGLVRSAHDCSEGGVLIAAAEMAMAGRLGLHLDLTQLPGGSSIEDDVACFAETPSRYLLEVKRDDLDLVDRELKAIPHAIVGEFNASDRLTMKQESLSIGIDTLIDTWRGTLDW